MEATQAMLLGVYIASWEGALRSLPQQCLVISLLAGALFAYARRRHGSKFVAGVLGFGGVVGLAVGVGRLWFDRTVIESSSVLPPFEWDVMAFVEWGGSAIAASAGLLAAWLILEAVAKRRRPRCDLKQ